MTSDSRVRRIDVAVPGAEYPVLVGRGARARLARTIVAAGGRPSRIHVISDDTVWALHGPALAEELDAVGVPVEFSVVPAGEGSKSPRTLTRLWRELLARGCDRASLIVAFGGGVIGDLAGFAAASVLRGIEFVQVPTTLLAMVDASVGGKTGINLPEGKNLVGAFHQPRAVVMDLDFLATLPEREFRAGCAEVIKTAAIRDRRFFAFLEREREPLLRGEPSALGRAVSSCVRIKADVVAQDERESRLRMILNFGHTLGHGVEAAGKYRQLLHGEAVAVGMAFAGRLGEVLERSERGTESRLEAVLAAYGLPVRASGLGPREVLSAMGRDKKRGRQGLRWVLLPRIGEHEIVDDAPADIVDREVRRFLAETES